MFRFPVSVLFSEPKIPQPNLIIISVASLVVFQCSSASRKFLNGLSRQDVAGVSSVSVLFSEPKIPQPHTHLSPTSASICFSALQRAENSSTNAVRHCDALRSSCFSALQRAENSSTVIPASFQCSAFQFQCSSASRKFLNGTVLHTVQICSAFQCSSASRKFLNAYRRHTRTPYAPGFSALQRAENSSTATGAMVRMRGSKFQCSSASRKFLNRAQGSTSACGSTCFSALQRAENSSTKAATKPCVKPRWFQCSSASRKFLNHSRRPARRPSHQKFQCSSASRKFLNRYHRLALVICAP